VVGGVDPGQMYSIPYFTMYVSFYTDNEEQWGLLYMKGVSVVFSNRCLFCCRPQIVKHSLEIYFDWASFYKFTDFGEYLF
jgi:hypothetical protein